MELVIVVAAILILWTIKEMMSGSSRTSAERYWAAIDAGRDPWARGYGRGQRNTSPVQPSVN